MSYVLAGAVLVGLIGVLNLLFTFGVVRRLREHERLLAERAAGGLGAEVMPAAGSGVEDFAASTIEGDRLSLAELAGRTVVGFFSTSCAPCRERLPAFVEYVAGFPGGRDRVLVVVVAEPGEAELFVAQARSVARVVVEPIGGPVAAAFGVRGYPTLAVVEDGVVVASGPDLDVLLAVTAA